MTLSVALILLQLFGNTFVFAQNVCSTLPDVPHAHLLTGKQEYQKGDTIGFRCEIGYTSGRSIRYNCTDQGWMPTTEATCKRKQCELPDEIPNGYHEITHGEDFVFGTTIKYFCNDGYQMISKEVTRTCLINQWSNHLPVCEPFRCQAPLADQGLTVQGLPDDDSPVLPDRFLTFSCETPGTILNGSSTLICGKDGKWDKPFPTCMDTCDVLNVPDSVDGVNVLPTQLTKGQILQFRCKKRGHVLQGRADVTCLENGQWSHPFPTCTDPRGCGPAPLLENGDTLTFSNMEFAHNARVRYQCKNVYVMEGGPSKTCLNGEWTGEIKCLKPCTLDPTVMDPQNIEFKLKWSYKLYAAHNTGIDFVCKPGTTHDGRVEMRQFCTDGQMLFPTCH